MNQLILLILLFVLFIYFGGKYVPSVLKKNKNLLLGVAGGLVLCSFFGLRLEGFGPGTAVTFNNVCLQGGENKILVYFSEKGEEVCGHPQLTGCYERKELTLGERWANTPCASSIPIGFGVTRTPAAEDDDCRPLRLYATPDSNRQKSVYYRREVDNGFYYLNQYREGHQIRWGLRFMPWEQEGVEPQDDEVIDFITDYDNIIAYKVCDSYGCGDVLQGIMIGGQEGVRAWLVPEDEAHILGVSGRGNWMERSGAQCTTDKGEGDCASVGFNWCAGDKTCCHTTCVDDKCGAGGPSEWKLSNLTFAGTNDQIQEELARESAPSTHIEGASTCTNDLSVTPQWRNQRDTTILGVADAQNPTINTINSECGSTFGGAMISKNPEPNDFRNEETWTADSYDNLHPLWTVFTGGGLPCTNECRDILKPWWEGCIRDYGENPEWKNNLKISGEDLNNLNDNYLHCGGEMALQPPARTEDQCNKLLDRLCGGDRSENVFACAECAGKNVDELQTGGCSNDAIAGWCSRGH